MRASEYVAEVANCFQDDDRDEQLEKMAEFYFLRYLQAPLSPYLSEKKDLFVPRQETRTPWRRATMS
jgi:hypothetical protein